MSNMENSCMDFIAPNCDWTIKISKRIVNLNYLRSTDIWNRDCFCDCDFKRRYEIVVSRPDSLEASLYEIIEDDPIKCMNYISEESKQNSLLLVRMAWFLSPPTIEKICKKVFTGRDIDMDFVLRFYEYFLPSYLSRVYSWTSLDLLIRASKAHPETFKELLRCLLKTTDIPSNVLQDFVLNISESSRKDFMKTIVGIELTREEFVHNLLAIYWAFKDCDIDEAIIRYVLTNLVLHGDVCKYNKDYGRLLLCFMKSYSTFDIRPTLLLEIIEKHCTPYKSQCSAILDDFITQFFSNLTFPGLPRSFNNAQPTDNFRL